MTIFGIHAWLLFTLILGLASGLTFLSWYASGPAEALAWQIVGLYLLAILAWLVTALVLVAWVLVALLARM